MFKSNADTSFHTHTHTTIHLYIMFMQLKDNQHQNENIKKYKKISSKMNRKSNELNRHNIRHIECIMHENDDNVVVAIVRKSI